MRHSLIILFLHLLFSLQAQSQSIDITGIVKDMGGNPIAEATIVAFLNTDTNKVFTYTTSANNGSFKIRVSSAKESVIIEISSIGFQPLKKRIEASELAGLSSKAPLQITLLPSNNSLAEIIVKSTKAKDTIPIATDNMNLNANSTLRDILNKTDGFIVSKDGAIIFNGVPITTILINKKQVFVNQNSIALDNLNYEIMNNLQIITNYKSKFDMDFGNFTSSVININTKKEFKGVAKFQIEAGAGYQDKYKVKGRALYFSDNFNLFITNNVNNISEKDISLKDAAIYFNPKNSKYLKNEMIPFFIPDNSLFRDFSVNTTVTIRKESNSYKAGFLGLYSKINLVAKSQINVSDQLGLISQEQINDNNLGNLLSLQGYVSKLLGKKSTFNYNVSFGHQSKRRNRQIDRFFILPDIANREESNARNNINTVSNKIGYISLINNKFRVTGEAEFITEFSKDNFFAGISPSTYLPIANLYKFDNSFFYARVKSEYRLSALYTFEFGAAILSGNEHLRQTRAQTKQVYQLLTRSAIDYTVSVGARGKKNKIDYEVSLLPTIRTTRQTEDYFYAPFSAYFVYKFSANRSIILDYRKTYNWNDLDKYVDTSFNSYANISTGNINYINKPERREAFSLSHHYSNIAKSTSYAASFSYTKTNNFLQNVFDAIGNNIYYYRNSLFSKKQSSVVSVSGGKGFHLTKQYHFFSVRGGMSVIFNNYPTITLNKFNKYAETIFNPSFKIELNLRNKFLNAIVFSNSFENRNISSQNNSFYKLNTYESNLSFNVERKSFIGNLKFIYFLFDAGTERHNQKEIDINLDYKQNDKLSYFVSGKSLVNLIGLFKGNITSLNTITEGNVITEIYNFNRIGFLILGIKYKF